MTPEQIEAKALEEYPDYYSAEYGSDISREPIRAAFIKGCQYAATPSAILRPAESPDAGREGFIEKVMDEVEGPHPYPRRSEICSMFENAMRLHWPASTPVTREEIEQWANYQYPVEGINVRSTQYANIDKRLVALATFDYLQGKAITPADPGSQVEAVDFTEWWINEGWQIRKNGTFIQIGASGTPMLGRPDDRIKSVNELFTLYKQSL